jgi:uncharacterized protein YcnI
MSTRRLAYFGLGGAAVLALLSAAPAAAHVTVQPDEAPKGGYAKLASRVPDESETAGTIKLEVTFPLDTPLASVRTKPMAGWTAQIVKQKLATPIKTDDGEVTEAVRTVVWTAQPGVRIGPGEFNEFEVSGGPLPDNTDRLLLPATQTYDDGTVVNWDAPPPAAGAAEPEHPAPVLKLVEGTGAAGAGAAPTGTTSAQPANQPSGTVVSATAKDDTARWLGGAGLAVGALGVGLAGGAMLANRRRSAMPSSGRTGPAEPDE